MLEADNPQVDYLGAHGNGKFYVVFRNQSFQRERVSIKFNRELVNYSGQRRARMWVDNRERVAVEVRDSRLQFEIGAKGIVAFAIENPTITLGLQAKLLAKDAVTLGGESMRVIEAPFGRVTAMLLSPGKGLTTSFVYTDALAKDVISATLRYRQGSGAWQAKRDEIYPFEFSTEINESEGPFECVMEIERGDQKTVSSSAITLSL